MKQFLLTFGLLAILWAPLNGQGITGAWRGAIETPYGKMEVVFRITAASDGYVSVIDSPSEGLSNLTTTSTVVADDRLVIRADAMNLTYEGIREDDVIKGTLTQHGMTMRLDLARDPDVQVAIIREMEGDPDGDPTGSWYGTLDFGIQKLRLVFHIAKTAEGYGATMDSPDQGAKGIPVSEVTFSGGALTVTDQRMRMVFRGVLIGDEITGTFTQGGSVPLTLTRTENKPLRPQEPQPPFPYESEDVTFYNKDADIHLAGTFTYPSESGRFPAVVLISGSGAQNRDEEVAGHKPFLVLADHLTRNGIAVLRYDDRGTAHSGGVYSDADIYDFATDALAAVEYLRGRTEVNPKKTGLAGHSEGASIAFIVAAANPKDVAFVVSLAGGAANGSDKEQRRLLNSAMGRPQEFIDANERLVESMNAIIEKYGRENVYRDPEKYLEELFPPEMLSTEAVRGELAGELRRGASPELWSLLRYDAAPDLQKIKCPVLALNGEKDLQVPAGMNLEAFSANVKPRLLTVRKYPELNHLFQHATTGLPAEYGAIEETMSPEVLDDIADWINAKMKNRRK